jgi:serine kinase of HPr protein (carbohydrate metabolism regulator)
MSELFLHAGCVSIDGAGVLLLGDSGSGKSDLALRLIDAGAQLVSDDQVRLRTQNTELLASPPEKIAGLLEARGVGILTLPYASSAIVKLAVRLVPRPQVERLPEPAFFDCLGCQLPLLSLNAFDASTVAKIRYYVKAHQ